MVELTVDAGDVAEALKDVVSPGKLRMAMSRAVEYMKEETLSNFDSEITPDGQAWASLAASTIASKGHSQILRRTSSLYSSIGGRVLSTSSGEVRAGAAHAAYAQYGTSRQPARQFPGASDRHIKQIVEFYEEILGD